MAYELTIGEFSRRCGLSASALRFYDECDLLPPADVNPSTGYRAYAATQVPAAVLIRDLRRLGMAIAAIRIVLDQPAGVRHKAVDEQIAALETSLTDARDLARRLHQTIDDLEVEMTGLTVDGSELARALGQVLPAVGDDPERPALQSVLIEAKQGSLRLVATDSYRLAIRDVVPRSGAGNEFRAVVAGHVLTALVSWLADQASVAIKVSSDEIAITGGGEQRCIPTVETEYPDYEQILSAVPEAQHLIVGREILEDMLDDLASNPTVRLEFAPAELSISLGAEVRSFPAVYTGAPLAVTLNPIYLADAIRATTGPDLVIEATTPVAPVIFRSADDGTFTTMLMPIRTK